MMIERVTKNMHAAPVMTKPRVTILGAGPAGIAAAYALTKHDKAHIEVLERAPVAGGNSTSFQIDGIWCDYGSHRFHPVADPDVIADVKVTAGRRPAAAAPPRAHPPGRQVDSFPPETCRRASAPAEALRRLASGRHDLEAVPQASLPAARRFPPSSIPASARRFPRISTSPMSASSGASTPTSCAVTLAERRVSSGSVGKILAKMARMLPGMKGPTTGRFYYPQTGLRPDFAVDGGQGRRSGCRIPLRCRHRKDRTQGNRVTGLVLREGNTNRRVSAEQVYSTIPLTTVVRLMDPPRRPRSSPPPKRSGSAA